MARRIARGNGDRFGFVDCFDSWVEIRDGLDISGMEVNGILIEEVQTNPDLFGGMDDEYPPEDGYDWYDVVVSAPYTYDGYDISNALNSIDGVISESEFEPLDGQDDVVIHVVFSNGREYTDTEDVIDSMMDRAGYTDDDIVSINGASWPFDGYRR